MNISPQIAALAVCLTFAFEGIAQDEKKFDPKSKPAEEWIKLLKEGENFDQACEALGRDGPYTKTAIPMLIDALADFVLYEDIARGVIADYGSSAVPDLLKALERPDSKVRAVAGDNVGIHSAQAGCFDRSTAQGVKGQIGGRSQISRLRSWQSPFATR